MLDQTNLDSDTQTGIETYDLVVIGAGIAGLNALNAASEYLPKGARALLVDQKDAPGGMWNTAYDYVRLHQPHPMFTVGNMKWDWQKPRDYLAGRDEVQAHLARSLKQVAGKMDLRTSFGQTVARCVEVDTGNGPMAEIAFHANDDAANPTVVRASGSTPIVVSTCPKYGLLMAPNGSPSSSGNMMRARSDSNAPW